MIKSCGDLEKMMWITVLLRFCAISWLAGKRLDFMKKDKINYTNYII